MYDRDYVKALEREIELTGDNRFHGWHLSSESPNATQSGREANGQGSSTRKPSENQD